LETITGKTVAMGPCKKTCANDIDSRASHLSARKS
jgi:hypothetical protein